MPTSRVSSPLPPRNDRRTWAMTVFARVGLITASVALSPLAGDLAALSAQAASAPTRSAVASPSSATRSAAALDGPGVSKELATYRAARVRDVRYQLALDVTNRDTATGTVHVRFEQAQKSDVILDFRGLAVRSIAADGAALPGGTGQYWNGAHVRIPAAALRGTAHDITLDFASPIAPAGAGIIRSRDVTDGADYLYTLLVPSDANQLFPTFDQPDLKARVSFTLTTPIGWRALANGAPLSSDSTVRGIVHRFAESAPLSTYLIAFAAGPWNAVTQQHVIAPGAPAVPVSLWSRRSRAKEVETDTLIAMNARALTWLGAWFGVPYPFGKFDFLLAPVFPFGGMEHPGAVFYNEESFIYRERPTMSQLLGRQATTFHEVAHQWFGDYVTMRWFDDLWLKEGFATYMAAKMQASLAPTSNAWKTFYLRNKPVAYATDATAGTTPVWQALGNLDQAKSNYGPIVYNKAPGILRQLDYLVGDDAFQRGLQDFLKSHRYGNATWRDLLQSIGRASARDLTPWGAQWILRPGMPIVEQQVSTANGAIARLALIQRPAQPRLSGRGAWPLKTQLLLYYDNGAAKPTLERVPVLMTRDTTVVTAVRGKRAPAFIFANEGDYGYALVLPDSSSVRWLGEHIGSVRDDFLRAMLWGSLWDLVREARLSPVRFASLALRALPNERDEQIASSLVGRIGTALSRYADRDAADSVRRRAESVFLAGALDSTRSYGERKAQLDAVIGLARDTEGLARLEQWLDANVAAGLPLRPPTRWAIVTRLMARAAPNAESRLRSEALRDSTSEGKRQAFVAEAARPDAATKQRYYARWFGDAELNEEWVTSSLRAFHEADQDALSRAYLTPSLDTLPWIQKNRRIFFLGSWLGATIGGQSSAEALAEIDRWLAAHPTLATDLRQKILQSRDELERTVSIRRAFAASTP